MTELFPPAHHDHGRCIADALAAAERCCAERGARLTPLRRRVLELVWEGHGPVGAYSLLDALRAEKMAAAPPTVYRALDFLLDQGLIHRIEKLNAFVGCTSPHEAGGHAGQFLICTCCGAVAEMNSASLSAAVTDHAAAQGFVVTRQYVEVEGLCPTCRPQEGR